MKMKFLQILLLAMTFLLLLTSVSCNDQDGTTPITSASETTIEPTPGPTPDSTPTDSTSDTVQNPSTETTYAPDGSDTEAPEHTSEPSESDPMTPEATTEAQTTSDPDVTTEEFPEPSMVYGTEIGSYCPIVPLHAYNNGGTVSIYQTQGKVTVLNFWATWCPPCVSELQTEFPLVTEHYGDKVAIVAVHVTSLSEDVQKYLDRNCAGFDMIFCQDAVVTPTMDYYTMAGGEKYVPYTLVLDETGKIVWKQTGATDFETLKSVIDEILK